MTDRIYRHEIDKPEWETDCCWRIRTLVNWRGEQYYAMSLVGKTLDDDVIRNTMANHIDHLESELKNLKRPGISVGLGDGRFND